ncbi:DUF6573 family protein [Nocardia sp. 004]|uniref:DUF6573 family protein n=1 Tax=Nocardia sp. 004 TaxID=3385978 RepID=UPI0039A2FBA6
MFENAEVIHSYTRAQAIADGFLFDVTEAARAERFRLPVALAFYAYAEAIDYDGNTDAHTARITAVLSAARAAIGDWPESAYRGEFRIDRGEGGAEPDVLTLIAHCGPGDQGEPVITIMRPADD